MANKRDPQYYCAMCRREVPLSDDGLRYDYVEVRAIHWCPYPGWLGMSSRERIRFSLCPKCYRKYEEKMRELISLQLDGKEQ